MFHIGLDLAWADPTDKRPNESGLVMLNPAGEVVHAGWTVGVAATVDWIDRTAPAEALLFVDAPLVVNNPIGQRLCENQVGKRYGRWRVSANSTNLSSPRLAGVDLIRRLTARGWRYHDGIDGPPSTPGRYVAECYRTDRTDDPFRHVGRRRGLVRGDDGAVHDHDRIRVRAANIETMVRMRARRKKQGPPKRPCALRSKPQGVS